jgi:hypothetical protein
LEEELDDLEDDAGRLENDREAVEDVCREVLDSAVCEDVVLEANVVDAPTLVLDCDSEAEVALEDFHDVGLELGPERVSDGDVRVPLANADVVTGAEGGRGDVVMEADASMPIVLLPVTWVGDASAMSDANSTARKN